MNDESAEKMISRIERAAGIDKVSALDKSLGRFTSNQSAINKVMARMSQPSAIDKALKSVASQQSAIDKAMARMSQPSALDKVLKSITLQQSAIDKAMARMSQPSTLDKAIKSFASHQSAIDKALARMSQPSGLDKALKSIASQQSAIDKALATMAKPSAIDQALKTFSNQHSAIEKAMEAFTNSNQMLFATPNNLLAMAETITDEDYHGGIFPEEEIEIKRKFNESSKELSEANDSQSFIRIFKKLPPILKIFLFYIFLSIIIPQVNSISANLLTPIVQSYLTDNKQPTRERIKDIKVLPSEVDNIVINDLRFITANVVHLREKPSTRSDILDEMTFGQIVTVLSKQRNWIEIMYEYENGEILYGWVYTRYTARFSK